MNILSGNTGEGLGNGVAETAAQIFSHLTLTGSLISIATTFLYYQATKKWFSIMAMVGSAGMKEAGSAMDNVSEAGSSVGSETGKIVKK